MNGTRGLVIGMLAAFIVGCSIGMVGGIMFARFRPESRLVARGEQRPGSLPGRSGRMLERIERTLDLTPDQRDRVVRILEESRRGYAVVRESTHAAIGRELTPAQRDEWKQMEERYLRERRRDSGRPPWRGNRP